MEIKKFISMVLDELQDLKSNNNKKNYIVQDLEFELGVILNCEAGADINAGGKIMGITVAVGIDGGVSKENIQKVKIKLKPAGSTNGGRQVINNT